MFLCVTFSTSARENRSSDIFDKADSVVNTGNLLAGMVELERIVFQSNDIGIQRLAIFKKAMLRKQQAEYQKATNELERIGIRNPQDSLFAMKAYQLAFCHYMAGEYKDALGTIDLYGTILDDKAPEKQDLLKLKVLCHNHLFEFEKAKSTIKELDQKQPQKNLDHLLSFYDQAPRLKDPEKARHLSIIPGLGQAYSGKILEGSVSFLLNASALGYGVWQVYSGYYFTGYVVGVTLLQKFHSGGQHRAEILAKQKNKENALNFNQKVISEL